MLLWSGLLTRAIVGQRLYGLQGVLRAKFARLHDGRERAAARGCSPAGSLRASMAGGSGSRVLTGSASGLWSWQRRLPGLFRHRVYTRFLRLILLCDKLFSPLTSGKWGVKVAVLRALGAPSAKAARQCRTATQSTLRGWTRRRKLLCAARRGGARQGFAMTSVAKAPAMAGKRCPDAYGWRYQEAKA